MRTMIIDRADLHNGALLLESHVGDHAAVPFAIWKKTRRCLGPTHAGACPVACHDATLPGKSIKSSSRRRLRTRGDGGPLAGPAWMPDRGPGHDNGSHGRAGNCPWGRVPSLAGCVGSD